MIERSAILLQSDILVLVKTGGSWRCGDKHLDFPSLAIFCLHLVEVIFCCLHHIKNFEKGSFLRMWKVDVFSWGYSLFNRYVWFFLFCHPTHPGQHHVPFQYSREGKKFQTHVTVSDSFTSVLMRTSCQLTYTFLVGAKNNMKSAKWRWQCSLPGQILIPLKREEFL